MENTPLLAVGRPAVLCSNDQFTAADSKVPKNSFTLGAESRLTTICSPQLVRQLQESSRCTRRHFLTLIETKPKFSGRSYGSLLTVCILPP